MSTYAPDSNSHSSEEPETSLFVLDYTVVKFKETAALGRSGGGKATPGDHSQTWKVMN